MSKKTDKEKKTPIRAGKKVWRITSFDEIYKLPDDKRKGRKGPLAYTKSFVSLSGMAVPCEVSLYERLKYLKARPERHLLRSVYEDLKNWSADKLQEYQGYLVTHAGRPADYDYIAAQINVEKNELKKAMRILSQIGLIEQVVLNGQLKAKNEVCPPGAGNSPDNSGKERPSLKKAEGQGDPTDPKGKQKATSDKTAVAGCKGKDKAATAAQGKAKGKGKEKPKAEVESNAEAELPKAEPKVDEPTESDVQGGENALRDNNSPPGSALLQSQQSFVQDWPSGDYNHADCKYAERIFRELGYGSEVSEIKAVREITSMASVWHSCQKKLVAVGLSPEEIDKFGFHGIKTARRLLRKMKSGSGKKVRNPPAMWNRIMQWSANQIMPRDGPKAGRI